MNFIKHNWFLLILLLALFVGYNFASELQELSRYRGLNWSIVAVTMFVMAWPMEFGQLRQTTSRPLAPLLAVLFNIGFIPILAWPLVHWIGGDLGTGIMIAAATPCTMATASVWTRRGGGDDSVSMLVTIITNGTCFLVMPFWIYLQSGKTLDPSQLYETLINLLAFVVTPIVIAQIVRLHQRSAVWATKHKLLLSVWAMLGISAMVLIGSITMGLRVQESQQSISLNQLILVAFLMGGIHVTAFWTSFDIAKRFGISRPQRIAVAFSGSQKTLMVGISICILLGASLIPIVLYHTIQLIIDTNFAHRFRVIGENMAKAEAVRANE